MEFGQTHVLKTAKDKIAAGIAIFLFGVVAVLAAPSDVDKAICSLVIVVGAALITRCFRQDGEEKRRAQKQAEKSTKTGKRKKRHVR